MSKPLHLFDARTYSQRRRRLMEKMGDDLILLLGHENSPINCEDNYYPFRQDSSFLYYAGLDTEHLAVVMDGSTQKVILFGDNPSLDHVVWMGPQPTVPEMAEKVGINDTSAFANLQQILEEAQQKGQNIHFLPPYRHLNKIRLSRLLNIPVNEVDKKASLELVRSVIAQREIKSDAEIAEMEKAVTLSGKMHKEVIRQSKAGMKEAALVGVLHQIAAAADCQLGYTPILTINGQTLHNHSYHNTLQKGQLLLGDFGANSLMNYAGDITRTSPVNSKFTTRQKEIYQIVLDAEMNAINSLEPDIRYMDIHLQAAKDIVDGLKGLGLMKGDTDQAVREGAHALFFPHGLGHMIGLDVHDMEDLGEYHVGYAKELERSSQFGLKSLRLAKTLRAGFVLTVEPGIYFIPELIDQWKAQGYGKDFINYEKLENYRDFGGIRIEDDVLVTQNGYKVLGEPIPKTIEEIENLKS